MTIFMTCTIFSQNFVLVILSQSFFSYLIIIFRITERGLSSSVVPDLHLKEFSLQNEPVLTYRKDSKERKELLKELEKAKNTVEDVPIMIGGKEIRTKDVQFQVRPKY